MLAVKNFTSASWWLIFRWRHLTVERIFAHISPRRDNFFVPFIKTWTEMNEWINEHHMVPNCEAFSVFTQTVAKQLDIIDDSWIDLWRIQRLSRLGGEWTRLSFKIVKNAPLKIYHTTSSSSTLRILSAAQMEIKQVPATCLTKPRKSVLLDEKKFMRW